MMPHKEGVPELSLTSVTKSEHSRGGAQLAAASEAMASGAWQLSEIFDRKEVDGPPARILTLVLT
jgi:hypothetical protein